MDKERAIFHELLIDFALPALALDKGKELQEILEKRLFSEVLNFLDEQGPYVGHEHDQVTLLRAVVAVSVNKFQMALSLVGETLPFVSLDRTMCALAHWIGAVALDGLGRPEDALYWCSLAAEQSSSPRASQLQVGILCYWAEISAKTGHFEQATARVHLALRRARLPHALFHSHLTAARLWWQIDEKKAKYHLELAQNLAKTPERLRLIAGTENIPRPKMVTGSLRPVTITLLGGLDLSLAGVRISAVRSPRAALLLAYLIQNDGEAISEIAEQILPVDSAIKSFDKARSDRAARVRQHLTQARRLLADPAGVVCKGGRLWLSKAYDWDSDLRLAVLDGTFDGGQVLPVLSCPWIDELSFTINSPAF